MNLRESQIAKTYRDMRWNVLFCMGALLVVWVCSFAFAEDGASDENLSTTEVIPLTMTLQSTPDVPVSTPTALPTNAPTIAPTLAPTIQPTQTSIAPTLIPTETTLIQATATVTSLPTQTESIPQPTLDSPALDNPAMTPTALSEIDITPVAITEALTETPTQTWDGITQPTASTEATSIPTSTPFVDVSGLTPTMTLDVTTPINPGIMANAAHLPLNTTFSFMITAQGLTDIKSLELACQVDPSKLRGRLSTAGELFSVAHDISNESGFMEDGHYSVMATLQEASPSLHETRILWILDYETIAAGQTQVMCEIGMYDAENQPLPLSMQRVTFTLNIDSETSAPPTETLEQITTIEATPTSGITPTIEITPTSLPVATVPPTPTGIPLSRLHGQILSYNPSMVARISSATGTQDVVVQADGSFTLELPQGTYELTVTAPQHLPHTQSFILIEPDMSLQAIMLTAGDLDGNGTIDQQDLDIIRACYGQLTSSAPAAFDLNQDSIIDIYDLAIISSNMS
ncbi:hypothetical protein G4Y79_16770 [Phototrophicus methaneseepsis]|uniref:Dockerin domain-containing protein n=1 Tax=Phototrophicus methaneseepsis TaxID=2710758 RepID=A0A7S8ID96_9CHLR|nr:dockerin type I domain-containing protein [Phototrophicus methaneseepsis]QPC81342.1 hypothetical protein G4Y79_16770 [Phototrophicus methaneseepsis]